MKIIHALLLLCCICLTVSNFAQNLVLNPGFENIDSSKERKKYCTYTKKSEHFNNQVQHWNTFSGLTPDIIIRPDTLEDCLYPIAHSGQNMIGMIMYHPGEDTGYSHDYHEVIQGKLKKPLKVGKEYKVSVWIYFDTTLGIDHLTSVYNRVTPIYPMACNNLGFIFMTIPAGEREVIRKSVVDFGMKPQVVFEEVMLTPRGKWKKLSATFIANNAYTYFMMGNFSSDFMTNVKPDDFEERFPSTGDNKTHFFKRPKRIAYYCFDDINVSLYNGEELNITEALSEENVYVFKTLNFETGKAILPEIALNELNRLVDWLSNNPIKNAEIAGHTDNVGKAVNNQLLSEKRAQSVYNYLIEQGIDADRLNFKGYGESQPKATNTSVKGRETNRRVECKIVN